ncbi:MAG TPA: ATP-binding protein [Polyangiaceae bacterium]|nr:ATP-binding protein [Polyangiaceae bacterium]
MSETLSGAPSAPPTSEPSQPSTPELLAAEDTIRRDALVLAQLQDAVVCLDNELNVVYWNDAAEQIFQWKREELLNRSILVRLPPDSHAAVEQKMREIRSGTSDPVREWEDSRKDGSRVWISWRSQAFRNAAGEVVGTVSVGTDVTERREAEVKRAELERQLFQAQKMETMGTLAGGIAHDFNNILTAILMQAELGVDNPSTPPALRESLREIRRSSLRAKELVSRILTFSRHDETAQKPVDLRVVVQEAAGFVKATLASSVRIRVHAAEPVQLALGNENQMHQVLVNLGSNAAQATPAGGEVEFRLSMKVLSVATRVATNVLDPGSYVVVTVTDAGSGMDASTLERIFDPFFTTKPAGHGTGLGLAIARRIVQNHGGGIDVASTPGRGSTFSVYVPAAPLKADAQRSVTPPRGMPSGKGEHVLVVDDEESIAILTRVALESLGYRATHVTSVEAFWREFEREPNAYQVVLTDHSMHRSTGLDLAVRLRNDGHSHPIIIATGNRARVDQSTLARVGRAVILDKPFEIGPLGALVRSLLDAR